MKFVIAFLFVFAPLCFAADAPDCSTFTWDMTHELTLFGGTAQPLASARNTGAAPQLSVDTLYAVQLHPLADVTFAHPLGKAVAADGSSGGVLKLHVQDAGLYRITLDAPLWIDVVANGELVTAKGFQGRQPCKLSHKSVEWSLPANADLVVRLDGAAREQANLAVTVAPSSDSH